MCKQYDVLFSITAIASSSGTFSATGQSAEEPITGEVICDTFKLVTTVTTSGSVVQWPTKPRGWQMLVGCGFDPLPGHAKKVWKWSPIPVWPSVFRVGFGGFDHPMSCGCLPTAALCSLRRWWVKCEGQIWHPLGCDNNGTVALS